MNVIITIVLLFTFVAGFTTGALVTKDVYTTISINQEIAMTQERQAYKDKCSIHIIDTTTWLDKH